MSQDLFAAFGEDNSAAVWGQETSQKPEVPASKDKFSEVWSKNDATAWTEDHDVKPNTAEDDEDDFGDFEDASPRNTTDSDVKGEVAKSQSVSALNSQKSSTPFKSVPNKAVANKSKDVAAPSSSSNQQDVGFHPFAGRMDLLFEAGDDEYDAGEDELADLATNPEAAMAYSKRIIAEQEAAAQLRLKDAGVRQESSTRSPAALRSNHQPGSSYSRQQSTRSPARDPNVLFDADDLSEQEDEDDDFDDFENAEEAIVNQQSTGELAKNQQESSLAAMDLLGLDDMSTATDPHNNMWPSKGDNTINSVPQESTVASMQSKPSAVTREEEDFWDDFEASPPSEAKASSDVSSSQPEFKTQKQPQKQRNDQQGQLPPTNVPPPAVLLSIFSSVFAEADEALFNTISKLDLKQKQMLLAHPASHQFLKRYLGHCTALARIIAGRKVRWKRDQRLSQSMRIGPAAAGGKGGMKLTGLDKSETAKEDREVLDVLRLWKAQVGKLRTAVTAASAAPGLPKLPPVPDITDQMSVKTLKSLDGGLTAPQPCALCGLKREERVSKIDVEVDDSFGEWWVQGMSMHLSCREFWDEFERKLKSR